MANDRQILKWRFDVSTFELIGRELITDRVTALFELVKNCYDANATEVAVSFDHVAINGDNNLSCICIKDNGIGMSFGDIRDKWMVIGTANKRHHPYTPEPFCRKCVGEKGIGRFAVDKLGNKLKIITKQENEQKWLNVEINWDKYSDQSSENNGLKLFTDIENLYTYSDAKDVKEHGTSLIITNIREIWVENDIKRFISEIAKLISPFANLSYPFQIRVKAPQFGIDTVAIKQIDDIDIATTSFSLGFNIERKTQETVSFNEETGGMKKLDVPLMSFGGIKMKVYYFDDLARRKYRKEFPNNQIDGIKIYRDDIITTPFAESQFDNDKKKDILGIDKRLWRDLFNRVSTREIIGIVEITKKNNPQIIDATNRQDFVDNHEYSDLKEFIIVQLGAIEEYKKFVRKISKKTSQDALDNAGDDIKCFISSIESLAHNNPSLKDSIDPVLDQAKKTDRVVKKAIKEKRDAEKEFIRKENIYMSIMSLQEYAIHITHAVRTTLNKIRDRVEYFNKFFPNPEENDIFKLYAKEMYEEFMVLNKVIDYMLSYSKSNLQPENIELTSTIKEVLNEYKPQFEDNGIILDVLLPEKITLENTRKQFFRDILQNLLDNSIKALKHSDKKIIRCTTKVAKDKLFILVSDTGCGIPLEKRNWVFGLYNTTTEIQGGAGIGLYIVKTRVESLRGMVQVIDSEFDPIGCTIEIELPFKK